MSKTNEAFGTALANLRHALHLSQDELGARLGVSRRTLTRWEVHGELPPIGQRKHLATAFPDAPPKLVADLIRTLGLGAEFAVRIPGASSPNVDPALVDEAFFSMAEQLDIGPKRLREALIAFLGRLREGGLTIDAACVRLGARRGKKSG
jgi:transcriptional regulator with XRE-family HTH domain